MSEWWTYAPSDFLLFSPKTYYRLLELYNRDIWPAHLPALALGIAMLLLLRSRHALRGRLAAALLAACWAWLAWSFHFDRYATINWAAKYFAAAFAIEAALLVVAGVIGNRLRFAAPGSLAGRSGFALLLLALIAQPLLGPALGRPWAQAEVFGVAPDPTVVATLGVILAARGGRAWLAPIPLLWCVINAGFLSAMGSPEAWVMAAALLAFLFAWVTGAARDREKRAGG